MDNIDIQLNRMVVRLAEETNPSKRQQIVQLIQQLKEEKIKAGGSVDAARGLSQGPCELEGGDDGRKLQQEQLYSRYGDVYNDVVLEQYYQAVRDIPQEQRTLRVTGQYRVPAALYQRLKEYQRAGFRWLVKHYVRQSACLLCDEPGLGKTVQVLALLETARSVHRGLHVAVVAPRTVCPQWVRLANQWAPVFRTVLLSAGRSVDGAACIRGVAAAGAGVPTIYVMSYGFAAAGCDALNRWIFGPHPTILVADEAHYLRNEATTRFQQLNKLGAAYRIGLTGTPLQNSYQELFTILHFVKPGLLGSRAHFVERYSRVITGGSYRNSTPDAIQKAISAARSLQAKINTTVLRRLKRSVEAELPRKAEFLVSIRLSYWYEKCYLSIISTAHRANPLQVCSALRQICGAGQLNELENWKLRYLITKIQAIYKIPGPQPFQWVASDPNIKEPVFERRDQVVPQHDCDKEAGTTNQCGELGKQGIRLDFGELEQQENAQNRVGFIEDSSDSSDGCEAEYCSETANTSIEKVLIFANYLQVLDQIEFFLKKINITFERLDGNTKVGERIEIIRRFQTTAEVQVLLLSTQVGGVGLNLTAANHIFLMQPHWNPAVDTQSCERSWRIGQTRAVNIYRLIYGGTIEEKMVNRQNFKKQLIEKVLNNVYAQRSVSSADISKLLRYSRPSFTNGWYQETITEEIDGPTETKSHVVFEGLDERLQEYM